MTVRIQPRVSEQFVLVVGWPGSGKSTLAAELAVEMRLPLLAKDEIKEALMDGLGRPHNVAESQRLGRAAVLEMLRLARHCPGAGLDSTWFITRSRSRERCLADSSRCTASCPSRWPGPVIEPGLASAMLATSTSNGPRMSCRVRRRARSSSVPW